MVKESCSESHNVVVSNGIYVNWKYTDRGFQFRNFSDMSTDVRGISIIEYSVFIPWYNATLISMTQNSACIECTEISKNCNFSAELRFIQGLGSPVCLDP
jgi:hypothetical protein